MEEYLDTVESPERAANTSKELMHHFHLGGFKHAKFVRNERIMDDQPDESPQLNETKLIATYQEESLYVLEFKWDNNKNTEGRSTPNGVTKSLTLIVSLVSQLFETIGVVARITISAQLLPKGIWRVSGQHMNEELLSDVSES